MGFWPMQNQVTRKNVSVSNLLRLQNFPSVPTTPVTLQGAGAQSGQNDLNLFKIYNSLAQRLTFFLRGVFVVMLLG